MLETILVVATVLAIVAILWWISGAPRPAIGRLFSRDEARRIAANVAKLPELLRK